MCGIAGIFHLDNQPLDLVMLRRMTDLLRHRGPDDEGYALFNTASGDSLHLKGADSPSGVDLPDIRALHSVPDSQRFNLALSERRLAILDLSPAGHTPMNSADGHLTISFNGEIYNFLELRKELSALGHSFHSNGDTEVLLTAYRQWGVDCVRRLNGMWAFAIWDAHAKRLFCARDRFGVKPFYYVRQDNLFAFASEPKSLWASGLIKATPNVPLLHDFLAGYDSSDHQATMFAGIHQLLGGHTLVIEAGKIEIQRFWTLPINPDLGSTIESAKIARVGELLTDAVRLRLRSDVPVGTCLSGGLDSSAIVCLVNDLMQSEHQVSHALIGDHQKTFTASYQGAEAADVDESAFAKMIIDATGAEWHQVYPDADTLVADLQRFLWHHDEPPLTTSLYAQWSVMRLVRQQGVTVTLDGQGADELLAGYSPYDVFLSQSLHSGNLFHFLREIRALASVGTRPIGDTLKRVFAYQLPRRIQLQLQARRQTRMLGMHSDDVVKAVQRHQETFDPSTLLNLPRYLGAQATNNLPYLLRVQDRNSMAFSVEARTPFLDFRFAEYVSQLPAIYRIHNGWTKYALRQSMNEVLPQAICWRRDKKGFPTPHRTWMRALYPMTRDLFTGLPRSAEWLDMKTVQSTLADDGFTNNASTSWTVWRWLAVELWLRMMDEQQNL